MGAAMMEVCEHEAAASNPPQTGCGTSAPRASSAQQVLPRVEKPIPRDQNCTDGAFPPKHQPANDGALLVPDSSKT